MNISIGNFIGSFGSSVAEDEDIPPLGSISLAGITTLLSMGDSIMDGSNASPSSESFRSQLLTNLSLASVDCATGGRGYYEAVNLFNVATYTRAATIAMDETGLNDLRRSSVQKTFNKIESSLNTMLARFFAASGNASGSAAVTRAGGTFTDFGARSLGGVHTTGTIPGNDVATFTSSLNATWTWTFTGEHFFIIFSGSDGSVARGTVEVRVDGVLIDTVVLNDKWDGVSDGSNTNTRGPVTKIYFNNGSGAHTVQVKNITTSPVPVDRFGYLDSPSNVGIFFLLQIPKVTDYAKAGLDQANDAILDQADDLRRACIAPLREAGFKAYYVPLMIADGGNYNTSTGIDSDGVHPTNTGHDQITTAIQKRIA